MDDPIFDMEQQIMNCWSVVDDVDALYKHFGDNPRFASMNAREQDEIMNLLLGIKSLYQLKFDNLWCNFEKVAENYHMYRRQCTGQQL